MKKKSAWKMVLMILILVGGLAAGGFYGIRYYRSKNGKAVEVISVGMIDGSDWIGWGDMEGTSGTVTSNVSQNVMLTDNKVVDKVFVSEGDQVKIGDKLLHYDTTLLELDQELQEIVVQELNLEIKSAEEDLAKLKNTTPVVKNDTDDSDELDSSLLDSLRADDLSKTGDEASMYQSDRLLLASSEDGLDSVDADSGTETLADKDAENSQKVEIENVGEMIDYPAEVIIDDGQSSFEEQWDLEETEPMEYLPIDEAASEVVKVKGEKNLSLKSFLDFLRIKEVKSEEEEALLADTRDQIDEEPLSIGVMDNKIKLIPHFSETLEKSFEKKNTYRMLIKGLKLEKELSGKIYGTSYMDGTDYPEIGGFILSQKKDTEEEDLAELILAFHEGLEEQHEYGAILQDMYLEIELQPEEILAGTLTLMPSDKKKDNLKILVEKEETKPETEDVFYEEIDSMEDVTDVEEQVADSAEQEAEMLEEIETELLFPDETESENGTETEDLSDQEPVGQKTVGFQVEWNHGTNPASQWPDTLELRFFQGGVDPVVSFKLNRSQVQIEESGTADEKVPTDYETGDAEPETEGTTVDEFGQVDGLPGAEDAEGSGSIVDENDPYPSSETWTLLTDWDMKWGDHPGEYQYISRENDPEKWMEIYWSKELLNYIPVIRWNLDEQGEEVCKITLTYKEPEESPLAKLDPLSELTYESGLEERYYKGEGTRISPYVFFVTDGVKIHSSFVNWVLGFNAEGTKRIGVGSYIVLEIREADTMEGAFIRSIGLDGTILKETGFGPGTYWIFSSDSGMTRYEEEVPEPFPDDGPDFPGGDPGWSDDMGYTSEELTMAIDEKEREIRRLKLDKKEAELKLKKYNKEMEESTVVSAVNGYVQSVGGTDYYLVVSSSDGMYLKTTVSEMDLDTVSPGMEITCQSWENGSTFTATVTQVDSYPDTNTDSYFWGGGNTNSSNYPVLAVIDGKVELSEYEYVNVKYPSSGEKSKNIYLEKAYIRSENGQSYVYIVGDDGRLKKQYIRTGGNSYGYIEVKEGLKKSDRIAFPYGKHVKEGAAVKHSADDEDIEW